MNAGKPAGKTCGKSVSVTGAGVEFGTITGSHTGLYSRNWLHAIFLKISGWKNAISGRRIYLVALLVLLCMLILALRLFYLQVSSHDYYATLSQENRMKIVPVPPTRGLVYDRNMNLLAANKPSYPDQGDTGRGR